MRALLRQDFLEGIDTNRLAPYNTWCRKEVLRDFPFMALGGVTLGVDVGHEGRILDEIAQRDEKRRGGAILDLACGEPGAVPLTFGDFSNYRGRPVPEVATQIRQLYEDARGHFYPAENLWVPVQGIERVTSGFYLDPVLQVSEAGAPAT